MQEKERKVSNEQLIKTYRDGFSEIGKMVEGFVNLSEDSAKTFIDTYEKANEDQLTFIRFQKIELEKEVKKFLAYANSRMAYLSMVEKQLFEIQVQSEQLKESIFAQQQEKSEELKESDPIVQ